MNNRVGWYKLVYPEKFIKQLDEHMQSMKIQEDGIFIEYKSSLELKFIKYCEMNSNVVKFSLEPFAIKYIKPTDGNFHRYYIDFYVEFKNGCKFLVEIKPYSQTKKPVLRKSNCKAAMRYQNELITYYINQSKWKAAKEFALKRNLRFVVITEKELN